LHYINTLSLKSNELSGKPAGLGNSNLCHNGALAERGGWGSE
jgi:hypothetical protein